MPRGFRRFAWIVLAVCMLPATGRAAVDASCGFDATSAVVGTVRNKRGEGLGGVLIQARQTNKETPVIRQTTTITSTDPQRHGTYVLCVPHDTYDIRASNDPGGLYATTNRPVTTFVDLSATVDFELEYKLNLTITPVAVSIPTPGSSKLVTWKVRSKAPCTLPNPCTAMQLTLDHKPSVVIPMAFAGPDPDLGAPSAGGWNVWTYSETLAHPLAELARFAKVRGYATNLVGQTVATTEHGIEVYLVDNQAPKFGPQAGGFVSCGNSAAGPFSPQETTNPWAKISVGVCDPESSGGSSSLDPYSVQVEVRTFPGNVLVPGGSVVLNQLTIEYLPGTPFALGEYKFTFSIKDNAGNQSVNATYYLDVTNSGGSIPTMSGFQPANLGEGCAPPQQMCGIVIGASFAVPSSVPVVAFLVKDADGQLDLSYGTLRVRIYGPSSEVPLYDYDPSKPPCQPNAGCGPNAGYFNQGTGRFDASGFSLVGKPPGLYMATASISDHGGNAVTRTWRWLLVAAV